MAARPSPPRSASGGIDAWLRVVALASLAWALFVATTGGFVVEVGPPLIEPLLLYLYCGSVSVAATMSAN